MVIIDHMSSKSTFGANNVSNYLSMEYHDHEVMCRNILDGKIMMMCQISLRREYHDPTDGGIVMCRAISRLDRCDRVSTRSYNQHLTFDHATVVVISDDDISNICKCDSDDFFLSAS